MDVIGFLVLGDDGMTIWILQFKWYIEISMAAINNFEWNNLEWKFDSFFILL